MGAIRTAALFNLLVGLLADLEPLVAANAGESALDQHGADLSYHPAARPDVVVYPESTEEVAAVLAYADRERIPVIPFGAGTSLEGHVIPLSGGISLDLSRKKPNIAVCPGATRHTRPRAGGGGRARACPGGRDAAAARGGARTAGTVVPRRSGRRRDPRGDGGDERERDDDR